MVSEVETILNQIKEQVRAAEAATRPMSRIAAPQTEAATVHPESLNGISAHLTTTARAWDRLPPIFSNRRGAAARIELWIKTRLKSLTRWFTWEQVNFNAAVHHALTNMLAVLNEQSQQLTAIQTELARERDSRAEATRKLDEARASISARLAEVRGQLLASLQQIENNARANNATSKQLTVGMEQLANEINRRLGELAADLREEQRVCFKQLTLQATETAVSEDRNRRAIESRLENLEQR
jgi:DNA anti-recombination protein RmuC